MHLPRNPNVSDFIDSALVYFNFAIEKMADEKFPEKSLTKLLENALLELKEAKKILQSSLVASEGDEKREGAIEKRYKEISNFEKKINTLLKKGK